MAREIMEVNISRWVRSALTRSGGFWLWSLLAVTSDSCIIGSSIVAENNKLCEFHDKPLINHDSRLVDELAKGFNFNAIVAPFSLLGPAFAIAAGWLFLDEKIIMVELAGSLLIMLALVINVVAGRDKKLSQDERSNN